MLIAAGITIAWPGTAASIPSGWTRVTALDSSFIRSIPDNSTNPGSTGGSATHSHATSGHVHTLDHSHGSATSDQGGYAANSNDAATANYAMDNHTHTFSAPSQAVNSQSASPSTDTISNDPAHLVVIWIESDGSASAIPSGGLCFWNDATALPLGYAHYADGKNRFLKGAAPSGDGGATVASVLAGHSHTINAHTHAGTAHTHADATSSGPSVTQWRAVGTDADYGSTGTHTHTVSFASANTADLDSASGGSTGTASPSEPTYYKLAIVESDGTLRKGLICVWRDTLASIPANWQLCDGSNGTPDMGGKEFLKGANTLGEIGDTGGDLNTHTHSGGSHDHTTSGHVHAASFSGGAATNRTAGTARHFSDASHAHNHNTDTASATPSVGSAGVGTTVGADVIPVYRTVAFIQLMVDPVGAVSILM